MSKRGQDFDVCLFLEHVSDSQSIPLVLHIMRVKTWENGSTVLAPPDLILKADTGCYCQQHSCTAMVTCVETKSLGTLAPPIPPLYSLVS